MSENQKNKVFFTMKNLQKHEVLKRANLKNISIEIKIHNTKINKHFITQNFGSNSVKKAIKTINLGYKICKYIK